MLPKTKFGRGGPGSMTMVANGEVENGFTFLPGMVNLGIDIVGTCGRDLSSNHCDGLRLIPPKYPADAAELLKYLSSPEVAETYGAEKMQPGK